MGTIWLNTSHGELRVDDRQLEVWMLWMLHLARDESKYLASDLERAWSDSLVLVSRGSCDPHSWILEPKIKFFLVEKSRMILEGCFGSLSAGILEELADEFDSETEFRFAANVNEVRECINVMQVFLFLK